MSDEQQRTQSAKQESTSSSDASLPAATKSERTGARPTKDCTGCGCQLDESNWPVHRQKKKHYVCGPCYKTDLVKRQVTIRLPDGTRVRTVTPEKYLTASQPQSEPLDPVQQRLLDEDRSLFAEADEKVERKNEGFIYVVTDAHFPGWVKIGTTRNITRRMQQYNNSVEPTWELHYKTFVKFRWDLEKEFIFHLEQAGYDKKRNEFFRCSVADAIRVIETIRPRN